MSNFLKSQLDAGGKPSTWLPPGRLVELIKYCKYAIELILKIIRDDLGHLLFKDEGGGGVRSTLLLFQEFQGVPREFPHALYARHYVSLREAKEKREARKLY